MGKASMAMAAALLAVLLGVHSCRDGDPAAAVSGSEGSEGREGGPVSALQPGARPATGALPPRRTGSPADPPGVATRWGSLRDQPPIDLPGGGTGRVALERDQAPVGSGILVYCLLDADAPRAISGGHGSLGPFDTRVVVPGKPNQEARLLVAMEVEHQLPGEVLCAIAVPVARPGEHRVVISLGEQDEPVAELVFNGIDAPHHAWLPFAAQHAGGGEGAVEFSVIGSGAALPRFDGLNPIGWETPEGGRAGDGSPLPSLWPERQDPGLLLEAIPGGFRLRSEADFPLSVPEQRLLARWWVNGEPYSPGEKAVLEQLRQRTGRDVRAHALQVSLDLDPAELGAQPGDRIGLQLLQVPDGWQRVDEGMQTLEQLRLAEEFPLLPRLSNRIEFEAH